MRWLLLLLAACIAPYHAHALPETGARLACLDVWLDADAVAEAEGPVVVFHVGNPCDHSTRVDLASVRVVGLDENGGRWPLTAYDPHGEIEPRRIDAYASGEEWIEFHAADPRAPITWLDVDVGRVEGPGPERWIRLAVPR